MLFFHQKILKIIVLSILLCFFLVSPKNVMSLETREIGTVIVDRLNMRIGAGTGFSVMKALKKGAQIKVLHHQKGWLKILHDGDVGYISDQRQYVKLYTIHSVSDGSKSDLDIARAKAKDINQRISEQTSELYSYTRQEKDVIRQLQKTDLTLNTVRRRAVAIKSELAIVSDKISGTRQTVNHAENAINAGKGYAVKRLVSLYKLNMLGEMNLLASSTSLYDLLKRRAALEEILKYDYQIIESLVEKKNRLTGLLDGLNNQKAKKKVLERDYQATINNLGKEKAKRKQILSELKRKKANSLTTIKYLKQASIKLDSTINALRRGGETKENKSLKAFSAFQGLLKMPVEGKIILKYGKYIEPRSGVAGFRKGIEIKSGRGTPIRAVFSGETIYSSWLNGYGNVVIVAHGENFHTVYAHAEEFFRSKGEHVETGEVIGTVGDSGSMSGTSLYFEVRHHGNCVDPLDWINNS